MIFTEQDKAFVKIFVPYYRLWTTESYENSMAKDEIRLDWKTLSRSCLKGMSKRTHGVAYRRLCVSLTSDAIGYSD